jgi:Fe-S cluster assembly protein SufD
VTPRPSEKEEVWRYTPIDELDLDRYAPAGGASATTSGPIALLDTLIADLGPAADVVVTHDGEVNPVATRPDGALRVRSAVADGDPPARLGSVLGGLDAFVHLHDAFVRDVVVVSVAEGATVELPVVVIHWCGASTPGNAEAPAVFPRLLVDAAAGSRVSVVEVVIGAPLGAPALVLPVTELVVGPDASVSHVALQLLGGGAWHLGRLAGRVEAGGHLATFTVGLGSAYDRARTEVVAAGAGARCEVRSAYLGMGNQVHDTRTLQDHDAPRTTSDLLCKGAVAGHARSVYSGLIRVRHGAVRSEAMQTNHNLVLDESAHADSVPNLDIAENDVRCSHASTVGPVDEEQRYYLESRGVPPERAERLIVNGFFDDVIQRAPVAATIPLLRREVGIRLAGALGIDAPDEARDG